MFWKRPSIFILISTNFIISCIKIPLNGVPIEKEVEEIEKCSKRPGSETKFLDGNPYEIDSVKFVPETGAIYKLCEYPEIVTMDHGSYIHFLQYVLSVDNKKNFREFGPFQKNYFSFYVDGKKMKLEFLNNGSLDLIDPDLSNRDPTRIKGNVPSEMVNSILNTKKYERFLDDKNNDYNNIVGQYEAADINFFRYEVKEELKIKKWISEEKCPILVIVEDLDDYGVQYSVHIKRPEFRTFAKDCRKLFGWLRKRLCSCRRKLD